MKYANYEENVGKLLGWYDKDIHTEIPTPSMEVSDADWQTALDNNYNYIDSTSGVLSTKDFRTFSEIQAAKLSELNLAYNRANQNDTAYLSTTFQADDNSQKLIVSVLSAGAVPDDFYWLDTNNNQVPMTYAELQGLSGAILTRAQLNFTKYQELKTLVNLASTQDELDLINW